MSVGCQYFDKWVGESSMKENRRSCGGMNGGGDAEDETQNQYGVALLVNLGLDGV